MDNKAITITRLGKVHAGRQEAPQAGTDVNYTSPIVLRSADGPPTVFYLNVNSAPAVGMLEQHLVRLYPPREGMFSRLKGALDPFPVDAKGVAFNESGAYLLNTILSRMATADLFGDGNEQLILVRNGGGVHVYSGEEEVFDYKIPTPKLKNFNYSVDAMHTARIGGQDHVFLVVNRSPYERDKGEKPYALLHVSSEGIRPIELDGFDAQKRRIVGIGSMGRSESGPGELLLLAEDAGRHASFHVYRYGVDGKPTDEPREYYGKLQYPFGLRFAHSPRGEEIVGFAPAGNVLLFLSPGKPVNWIREIPLEQKFKAKMEKDVQFLGPYPGAGRPLALVRHKREVFLLDSEGDGYVRQGDSLLPKDQPTPLLTLPQSSEQHVLVDVLVDTGGKEPVFLAIEHRPAQLRDMSDEELADAAKRYLDADDQQECNEELETEMRFNSIMLDQMDDYCKKHGIPCPDVNSIEEIKRVLPKFHEEQLRYAHQFVADCQKGFLVSEAQFEQKHPSRKRHAGDIVDWYRDNHLKDQLVLTTIDMRRLVLSSQSVDDYLPARKHYPELTLPQFQHYQQSGKHYLTGSLAQLTSDDGENAGYYLLIWQ